MYIPLSSQPCRNLTNNHGNQSHSLKYKQEEEEEDKLTHEELWRDHILNKFDKFLWCVILGSIL